jgi:GntR family transcriptional regulator, transcriptional repressor for pyruvate dehydrogenase complex
MAAVKLKSPPVSADAVLLPKSLTRDVKEVLLGWIREGKYPPGSQLPSVPELVSRLEVSRTVVREALQALSGMNLVSVRPGLGCFVNAVPPEFLVNSDVVGALLDIDTVVEVAVARRAIEASVAAMAAVAATEEDFEAMEEALFRIELVARRNKPMHSVTPAFHVAIARASHNRVLEKVVASFNSLMVTAGEVIEREQVGVEFRLGEYESHRELLQALRSRDADRARREMEAHIGKTVEALMAIRDGSR